ncbi:hypothetical protein STEG23_032406, partial [Scotinomys teguina]
RLLELIWKFQSCLCRELVSRMGTHLPQAVLDYSAQHVALSIVLVSSVDCVHQSSYE